MSPHPRRAGACLLDTYRPIISARAKSRGYSLDAYRLDLEELIELAGVSFR